MASEAELAHEGIAAINRGDVDALVAMSDPGIEIRDPDRSVAVARGHHDLREFFAEWIENFEDYRIQIQELHPAPGSCIVALCTQSGRGAGSGIEITGPINLVMHFASGKVIGIAIFARADDALADAGLRKHGNGQGQEPLSREGQHE